MRTLLAILLSGCLCLLAFCFSRINAAETTVFSSSSAGARALVFSDRRVVLADANFVRSDGGIVHVRSGTLDIPCFSSPDEAARRIVIIAVDRNGMARACGGRAAVNPAAPKLPASLTPIFSVMCRSGESPIGSEDVHPIAGLMEVQTPIALELLQGQRGGIAN